MNRASVPTIWPKWSMTVGSLIDEGALVRLGCPSCRQVMDIDLPAIADKRGRAYSLIDVRPLCRVTSCRGSGVLVASSARHLAPFPLASPSADVEWARTLTMADLDPHAGAITGP